METSGTYNKVLELEGLLLLLQSQDDGAQKKESILRLLNSKLDEIAADIKSFSDGSAPAACSNPIIELAGEDLKQEVADAEAEITAIEESMHEEIEDIATAEALNAMAEESTSSKPQSEIVIEGETAELKPGNSIAIEDNTSESEPDANIVTESSTSESAPDTNIVIESSTSESEPEVNIVIEGNGIDVNQSAFAQKTRGDIRKAFTLNDNYKFRRQLFNNSQQEYSEALSNIENMKSLPEAEEYIYGTLKLDKDDPDVKDFMDIISLYLGSKL